MLCIDWLVRAMYVFNVPLCVCVMAVTGRLCSECKLSSDTFNEFEARSVTDAVFFGV